MSREEHPALRASDAERDEVVVRLRDASAEGRLTLEEFMERMAGAYEARTHAELEHFVRDLPAEGGERIASRRKPTRILFSLFGSTERDGRIRVRRRVTCLMTFGNIDLDLRQATLEGDVITIVVFGAFGAVDVYVPEGSRGRRARVLALRPRGSARKRPAAACRARRSCTSWPCRSGPGSTSGAFPWRGPRRSGAT